MVLRVGKSSALTLVPLADHVGAIPTVADWLHGEWGHERPASSAPDLAEEIASKLSRDQLPVHVLALLDDVEVGVAVLKAHEMREVFPERTPWLGSLYVRSEYRGRGIASALVREIERRALALGFATLHLQTERLDGGLYARLGWTAVERLAYRSLDVLVMRNELRTS